MRLNMKRELREAFDPPKPKDKDAFLAAFPYPKLTYSEFVFSQIGYIRKKVWIISGIILFGAVGMVCMVPESSMELVWITSALVPFLAAATTEEVHRSNIFGMFEIEAGCRFALPQITGARMIITGICNFIVIAVITVISGIFSPFGVARSALYILTPYVSVCGISLAVFDRAKGEDSVYLSAAAALGVSLVGVIGCERGFYGGRPADISIAAVCAAGTFLAAYQVKKIRNSLARG